MTGTNIILILIGIFVILKIYLKIRTKWCTNKVSLIGRTVIVTGANQGIGYEAALEFAKRGGRVILACRNEERANEARERIVRETLNENVSVGVVDMGSLKSVRGFAKMILETERRLDVLVNNAGLGAAKDLLTEDGYRNLLQVNYLGPFLLTLLLLDLLKKTPGTSRIVNVSSVLAKYGSVEPHNLNSYPGPNKDYSKTKLLNILFTIRLAELLNPSDVSVFSVHPGAVKTEVFRIIRGWRKSILNFIMSLYFKSPEEGAQTTIYTALEQGIENLSGEHFTDCALTPRYPSAADQRLVKSIFDETLELLKCREEFKEVLNY